MNHVRLTQGSVPRTMARLSVPMMGGIFSAIAFNLADTYFVAELGTLELAAMSFTFPVVMVLVGVSWGLGSGMTASVSRAIGEGDETRVLRLSSDGLMLSLLSVLILASIGMMTIEPLFRALGASPDLVPLIADYMFIWYPGMVFLVVPMVGNATIRATGDTKTPALIIIGATGFNVLLDPILIFGWFGAPALGLRGAALATVIARGTTMVATILVLRYREQLLDLRPAPLSEIWASWKTIGQIAIPATATNLFTPIASAVITRLIAGYGASEVAAWGAGSRISAFVMIPILGYCSGLAPFVGQNWGATLLDRVKTARNIGYVSSLAWGGLAVLGLRYFGEDVAVLFSEDPTVAREIAHFLSIIPIGYAMVGVMSVTEETLNSVGRPVLASVQTLIYSFAMSIPLVLLGGAQYGLTGMFYGIAIADLGGGLFGIATTAWSCRACFLTRPIEKTSSASLA